MSLKKPHTLRTNESNEVPHLNINFDTAYRTRVEGLNHRDISSSAVVVYPFQSIETGLANYSATGSPSITKVFALADTYNTILFAQANARHSAIIAQVIDVTRTSISVEARTISGTANFSNVTTASFSVNYLVVGSNP